MSDIAGQRFGRLVALRRAERVRFPSLAHVGRRPSEKHSIDRKDNARGYEPGNVRWATASEQALNRRSNRIIEFGGVRLPLKLMAERHNLTARALEHRLARGWSIERALAVPQRGASI